MSPQNSCVEVGTLILRNVTILGDRVFKEVTKVKCSHLGVLLFSMSGVLVRRRD